MPATMARAAVSAHHKPRVARMTVSEGDHKRLVIEDFKALIGRAIETALAAASITKQAASYDMGYGTDQAPISKWISGKETPQFAKLWLLGDAFRRELVLALAMQCQGLKVETTIRLERKGA